ncbi:DASH complex subunit ask1 [Lecanora helva]
MSLPNTAAQRNLTLTEELEKLEQSITLTLQEIDHNFSRAHRIVTTSILPIVEQYAEHSKNVWEGSKVQVLMPLNQNIKPDKLQFWKQFFEASANVSLSGYEEPPVDEDTVTEDANVTATPSTSTYSSPQPSQMTPTSNTDQQYLDPSLSPSPAQPTPRPFKPKQQATIASYSSPYETLKRETLNPNDSSDLTLPSTPRAQLPSPAAGGPTAQSSPFAPPSTARNTAHRTPANDILLHRVLDKNWRLQATPHSTARPLHHRTKSAPEATPKASGTTTARKAPAFRGKPNNDDNGLDSSPAIAAPELHAEIFDTPARKSRIPGVSVFTPARSGRKGGTPAARGRSQEGTSGRGGVWSDSDDEDDVDGLGGMSPPKTMQFHVPQGRLMRTPAREASKRIVEDLLLTAGGNVTDDLDEDSPSVVKRSREDEDTF